MQGASEFAQLDEDFGNAAAQRVDHRLQGSTSGGSVRITIGGNDALVDGPGRLDLLRSAIGAPCVKARATLGFRHAIGKPGAMMAPNA